MHGWINLDKPYGMSSAFAVDRAKKELRKITRDFKIGHGGTLDPLATGVLPLAVGEATKLIPFVMDAAKAYAFTVTWGEERNTDDMEGVVTQTSDSRPARSDIEAILPEFTGEIQQLPPAFSAIKVDGVRAYDAARAGEALELKPRTVRVDSLNIQGSDNVNETTFLCHCGKGTYIRSLARDMGRRLGVYGYVSMLRRIKVGKCTENDAISLDKLEELVHKNDLGFLTPPQAMLDDILAISLSAEEAATLKRGQWIEKPPSLASGTLVACMLGGDLVAIAKADARFLKTERVFNIIS
jgi:tRNA pseudouridine55 synthase